MKRLGIILLLAACVLPFTDINRSPATQTQPKPTPASTEAPVPADLEVAILNAAQGALAKTYAAPVFDVRVENIALIGEGNYATAWLVPVNPVTGEAVPTEPGLALATWDGDEWKVLLPTDPGWQEALAAVPPDSLPLEVRELWLGLESIPIVPHTPTAALEGYLLPWEEGKTIWLSRSLAHDGSFPSGNAHYSFDFYISKTMYNIHASKAGTVWAFKDSVPNDDHSDVNFIVLQDTTTSPVTYQLYMHLAQNSIPLAVKAVGEPVAQGQFIGVADNTGQSTGHHLHFQVETEPYWQGYWGRSVDIVFSDVDINGGRPRVTLDQPYCDWPGDICSQFQSSYISGNTVHEAPNLPFGDLTAPQNGLTLQSSNLTLSGWAADDQGIASARFKANFGDRWQYIGPEFTASPFSFTWDVCSDRVPDGPVSLSVEIRDGEGNLASGLPGLRHLVKQYDCGVSQPACMPSATQVALFSDAGYTGACVLLDPGDFLGTGGLGGVGSNQTESVLVGANAYASLYNGSDLTGRGETFAQDDANLLDNRIGINTVSSVHVQTRNQAPVTPYGTFPENGESQLTSDDTIGLTWEDAGGAVEFMVSLDGVDQPWQSDVNRHIGPLSAGTHTWQVKARNAAGESAWTSTYTLQIQPGDPPGSTRNAPFSDNMEDGSNGWSSSNNWDQTDQHNYTAGGLVSWGYEPSGATQGYSTGEANAGDLTAPPVSIPAQGKYYLRFYSYYETEGSGTRWDRRWVQVSADNGPFQDVLQLSDDPPNMWLGSPAIDLSAYSGKTIRVRFHFETLDADLNTYKGWFIDEFSIATTAPTTCNDPGEPNNSTAQATGIAKNSSFNGYICPGGDIDYFSFSGNAGDWVGISTQAQSIGSDLDTYLFMLDQDGKSVLASNDDIEAGVKTDSFASYRLPRNGTYLIKLRAWNHPDVGGEDYSYTLSLVSEATRPTTSILSPTGGTFLPGEEVTIVARAEDSPPQSPPLPSGISRVDFYWHSGEWLASDWTFLGTDWSADPDYNQTFDTSTLSEQKNIAFYAQAYDWSGNAATSAIWGMAVDHTPPKTSLAPLSSPQSSTAVLLAWDANDAVAGLDHFDIQSRVGNNAWEDALTGVDGELRQAWAVVSPGNTTSFRMRGVDGAGNQESYPTNAETSVSVSTSFCNSSDVFEDDNDTADATAVNGVVNVQVHNFCNDTPGSDHLNDQDWVRINLTPGSLLIATAEPLHGATAAVLRLYAADGTTLLTQSASQNFGDIAQLMWESSGTGVAYLQVTHVDGRIAGNSVQYRLTLRNGHHSFMPLLVR